jgi:predicted nucleic acid-binding protein
VIVVDASVEGLLQTDDGIAIAARLLDGRQTLHAPHLIDVEVAQVLRRYVARGELYEERARQALDVLAVFPLTRYSHEPLLDRIWAGISPRTGTPPEGLRCRQTRDWRAQRHR